jgi:Flp pilus assembly protein TadG
MLRHPLSGMHRDRRGNVLVMTCLLMVGMIAFVALAVDVGYLYTVRNELQRTADASAIAAAWELVENDTMDSDFCVDDLHTNARSTAAQFAALNKVGNSEPGLGTDDVFVGYMANPQDPADPLVTAQPGVLPNAVQVRVRRTDEQNGEVSLFFARALGFDKQSMKAQATAALVQGFSGFHAPGDGSNLDFLPFALDVDTWNALTQGGGSDNWRYDKESKCVFAGCDGINEVNLYPQGTGSPGNRGTVDIGGANNSTSDLSRQIREGISAEDMADLASSGRSLEFTEGKLTLNGDTGISAGVKDDLVHIKGEPRIIPIFESCIGPGNNAEYTIVKFVGVRVMDVKLTGSMSSKRVIIQPCNIVAKGGIPAPGATTTEHVYSPVWLVR